MADNGDMAKILVVEDNASMREMLASIIGEKGLTTTGSGLDFRFNCRIAPTGLGLL
jgi:CheY-like chemotaxis protein